MKSLLKAQGRRPENLRNAQSGNVAVVAALCMMILVGMLAFVLDTGYLYATKNRYQNAVESAAMAGAMTLCDDPEQAAEAILQANLYSDGDGQEGTVFPGYYDQESGSFYESDDMPEGQYENAVKVSLSANAPLLTGFHGKANLRAAALAFLKRYSITSLNGNITLNPGTTIEGGDVYANRDVTLWKAYDCSRASVIGGRVLAAGQIHFKDTTFWGMSCPWGSGEKPDHEAGAPVIEGLPSAEEEVEKLRQRAGVILTEADLGGSILFWRSPNWPEGTSPYDVYFFDLTHANPGEVVFFDPKGDNVVALIRNQVEPDGEGDGSHTSNPDARGVTFVATCPIWLDDGDPVRYGGEYQDQLCLYSAAGIKLYQLDPGTTEIRGMVLRAGGNVEVGAASAASHGQPNSIRMRIIADGSIEIGNWNTLDVLFGPPCPPRIVRLAETE